VLFFIGFAFPQQLAPGAVNSFPAYLPFDIRHPLRRAVRLAVEPEDLLSISAVNTRQRVVAVLVTVDVGQRRVPVQFLQQAEPFPDKPGDASGSDSYPSPRWGRGYHNASECRSAASGGYG